MSYTINEIIQKTGKSQSTVLRWIKQLKKTNPKAITIEKKGKARVYKIDEEEVKRRFLILDEERKNSDRVEATSSEGDTLYVSIPKATLEALQEQLKAKDEQIKKLQEVNYIQSGFIAQVKMLGAGQKKRPKDTKKEGEIIETKAKEIKKKEEEKKKKNKKTKKGFFQKLFGF